MKRVIVTLLAATLGLSLAFTLASCASKAQQATSNQEELELRVKKDDMMKKLDEGTAAYKEKYKR